MQPISFEVLSTVLLVGKKEKAETKGNLDMLFLLNYFIPQLKFSPVKKHCGADR